MPRCIPRRPSTACFPWSPPRAPSPPRRAAIELALTEPGILEQSQYLVLLSISGTTPGFDYGPEHVPLNPDVALLTSILFAGRGPFVDTAGRFDPEGRTAASLVVAPGVLDSLVGEVLAFAFVTLNPTDAASNAALVGVVP